MFPTCAIHDFNKEGWIDTKLVLDYHLSAAGRSAFLLFSIRFMKDDADKSHTSERHDRKQEFADALPSSLCNLDRMSEAWMSALIWFWGKMCSHAQNTTLSFRELGTLLPLPLAHT